MDLNKIAEEINLITSRGNAHRVVWIEGTLMRAIHYVTQVTDGCIVEYKLTKAAITLLYLAGGTKKDAELYNMDEGFNSIKEKDLTGNAYDLCKILCDTDLEHTIPHALTFLFVWAKSLDIDLEQKIKRQLGEAPYYIPTNKTK